jgi:hypothetical protein
MNSETGNREKRICQIRERIKDEFYFTNEVATLIAERLLKEIRWK